MVLFAEPVCGGVWRVPKLVFLAALITACHITVEDGGVHLSYCSIRDSVTAAGVIRRTFEYGSELFPRLALAQGTLIPESG